MTHAITARAHTNIALVKYWGKRDATLMLPQTGSLSLTLDEFYTETTVVFDDQLTDDQVTLNHHRLSTAQSQRITKFLDLVRAMAGESRRAQVTTVNHVPTSAGLASSASAFAALAGAASRAAGLSLSPKALSRLARRGSGSATRSIYGGFVEWLPGTDDRSSYAQPIASPTTWPVRMVALILNDQPKTISSTVGMARSVATSPYYAAWTSVVATDLLAAKTAIANRDITALGHITETNAMRMHALTSSADPSFTYLTGESLVAMKLIQDLRGEGVNCYYTLDAGPNVKVLCDLTAVAPVVATLTKAFGADKVLVAKPGPGLTIHD